jgi:hypothetical protein
MRLNAVPKSCARPSIVKLEAPAAIKESAIRVSNDASRNTSAICVTITTAVVASCVAL